jgi:hypothetical protein
MEDTLVTIMYRAGLHCVCELAPDGIEPLTMHCFQNYDNAADYIRERYSEEQAIAPDAFKNEIVRRKKGSTK